jgi:hypothetical protein
MTYFIRRHLPWLSAVVLGLTLAAAGLIFVVKGVDTKNTIRDELRAEQIITSSDASIPGVLVQDAKTAQSQADIIKAHTLGRWGPYSELPREDPRRAQFIDGVALRSALTLSVMGFGLTDLVIAAGAIITAAGLATVALAGPALYLLAGAVVNRKDAALVSR